MKARVLKYAIPLLLYSGAWRSFTHTGWVVWIPVLIAFVIIPILELFIKPSERNLTTDEEEMAKHDKAYDWLLYMVVPLQYTALYFFLSGITDAALTTIDRIGRILSMGLICGIMGINVGHELGHRVNETEQTLARIINM